MSNEYSSPFNGDYYDKDGNLRNLVENGEAPPDHSSPTIGDNVDVMINLTTNNIDLRTGSNWSYYNGYAFITYTCTDR